jgi:hypothetical protein
MRHTHATHVSPIVVDSICFAFILDIHIANVTYRPPRPTRTHPTRRKSSPPVIFNTHRYSTQQLYWSILHTWGYLQTSFVYTYPMYLLRYTRLCTHAHTHKTTSMHVLTTISFTSAYNLHLLHSQIHTHRKISIDTTTWP